MDNEFYQKEETKRQAVTGFVIIVIAIISGILLFTSCKQDHEFRIKCIESGGYWQQNNTCINTDDRTN